MKILGTPSSSSFSQKDNNALEKTNIGPEKPNFQFRANKETTVAYINETEKMNEVKIFCYNLTKLIHYYFIISFLEE